ncbi:MAG: EamA family transporter [Actinobacteria bacterium]|nr:EamA family transporter [Actinomycetota bacterium]
MPVATPKRTRDLGILALATIAPLWGYSWIVSKVALGYSGPFTFAGLISGLGALCLFAVLAVLHRPLGPPPLRWTLGIGLLQTTLFNGLATAALVVGGAGKVSVLVYTMPFWLLVLARLFLGERLRGLQWPAVALAFAGLILVVRPWDIGGALSGVLACAAGLAWAAAALLVKLLQRRAPCETLRLTAWQLLVGCVPLLVAGLLVQEGVPDWTGAFIACLLYSVLLANAMCWALWLLALRSLPAGAAGMGTLAVPVIGVLAAWLQLNETPAPVEAAGMALIIGGLAALAAAGLASGHGGGPGGEDEPAPLRALD